MALICASVRLRGWPHTDFAFEWLHSTGRFAMRITSQNVFSEAWERSTATPFSQQAFTNRTPSAVSPAPVSIAAPHRRLSLFQQSVTMRTPRR